MDADRLVQLTTGPAFTWWVRHAASWLDPLLFKATNGRRLFHLTRTETA